MQQQRNPSISGSFSNCASSYAADIEGTSIDGKTSTAFRLPSQSLSALSPFPSFSSLSPSCPLETPEPLPLTFTSRVATENYSTNEQLLTRRQLSGGDFSNDPEVIGGSSSNQSSVCSTKNTHNKSDGLTNDLSLESAVRTEALVWKAKRRVRQGGEYISLPLETPTKRCDNASSGSFARKSTLDLDAEASLEKENFPSEGLSPAMTTTALPNLNVMPCVNIAAAIVFWYATSLAITALNKYLFDVLDFNYPLLVTFIHFTCISILLLVGFSLPAFSHKIPKITLRSYLRSIVPIAIFGSGEIALSNLAYATVSISVMMVIKSSLVVVTYLLSVVAGLEKFSWKLLTIVIVIVGSICLTVPGMEVKSYVGILFLSMAVLAAAIRWVIVHYQLQFHHYSPLQLMFLTQPLSAICLATPAFAIDVRHVAQDYVTHADTTKYLAAAGLISVAVLLAFLIILAEYQLVGSTSSVSLTIAGVGKEILSIVMSITLFGDTVDAKTCIGIACSILGIIIYSRIRLSMVTSPQQHVASKAASGAGPSLTPTPTYAPASLDEERQSDSGEYGWDHSVDRRRLSRWHVGDEMKGGGGPSSVDEYESLELRAMSQKRERQPTSVSSYEDLPGEFPKDMVADLSTRRATVLLPGDVMPAAIKQHGTVLASSDALRPHLFPGRLLFQSSATPVGSYERSL